MFRYQLVRLGLEITRLLLRARYMVEGKENIPVNGPYLVVLNHTSTADTPLLLLAFPPIKWRFFAVEKWRSHPLFGPLMAWLGAIYISREGVDTKKLREALDALSSGAVFGLAPEGTRSRSGSLIPAKFGAAFLASRGNVPVLPVGLINSDQLFANARRFRSSAIELHIGKPFFLPAIDHRARSRDLEAYTHYIMVNIAALLPARYWGVYGDSPALAALLRGDDCWTECVNLTMTDANRRDVFIRIAHRKLIEGSEKSKDGADQFQKLGDQKQPDYKRNQHQHDADPPNQ